MVCESAGDNLYPLLPSRSNGFSSSFQFAPLTYIAPVCRQEAPMLFVGTPSEVEMS
jgi:hypothetical protein